MNANKFIICVFVSCCILSSCNTSKKILYMQDAHDGGTKKVSVNQGIAIQPKDELSIIVSSRNPELAMAFNLPLHTHQTASTSNVSGVMRFILDYHVDSDGTIDFPILGKLKVEGLTREQLSDMLKEQLRENLIQDAIITVNFSNFKVTVLGEVRRPGTFTLSADRITLFEALSRAGDLTIYGRRDNILVSREKDGVVSFHRVDLRAIDDLLNSPAYYLQQNDVVYVEPNNPMMARSEINQNRSLSVWISLTALLLTITRMFIL